MGKFELLHFLPPVLVEPASLKWLKTAANRSMTTLDCTDLQDLAPSMTWPM